MAARLAAGIEDLVASGAVSGVRIAYPVESNAVFAVMPPELAERVRAQYTFADWPSGENVRRLMCAFDTTEGDVDGLLAALAG